MNLPDDDALLDEPAHSVESLDWGHLRKLSLNIGGFGARRSTLW